MLPNESLAVNAIDFALFPLLSHKKYNLMILKENIQK